MGGMHRPLRYVFFVSLGLLVASILGLIGFFVIGMVFFTYQGNRMDWIYPVAGFMAFVLPVSAFSTVVTGAMMVMPRFRGKRQSSN